jgi:predicted HTH domain antitoxin
LISIGAKNYAVDLYRDGKITLKEASELADVTVREMIDILLDRGIRGNVRFDQQRKAIEFIRASKAD